MVRWKQLICYAVLAAFSAAPLGASVLIWTGSGNGNWSSSGNWNPSNAPSSGDSLIFDGTASNNTSNVDENLDFSAVSFTGLTSDFTVNTSNSSVITIDASDNVSFANSQVVTVNVKIDGSGGVSMSNAAETGSVVLNAANQYFGPTLVNYGTLKDGQANSFSPQSQMDVGASGILQVNYNETVPTLLNGTGGGGSVVIGTGATLTIAGSSTFGGVISGSGGLEISNGGYFNVAGNNAYTGTTTVDAASELLIDQGASMSQLSTITGSGTLAFENTGSITFGNYITSEMNVLQEGIGTTTLTGVNDYSGTTLITNGVLTDGSNSAFSPYSTVKIGTNGTLDIEHTETISEISSYFTNSGTINIGSMGTLTLTSYSTGVNAALTGGGSINLEEGAELALTGAGANTFNGSISLNFGSSLQIGDGGLGQASISGSEGGNVTLINDMPMTVNANLGGSSEDNLQLSVTGSSTATLNPATANIYRGATTIDSSGTLADGKDYSFSPNSVISIDRGGTLEADFNETIAGLSDGFNGGSENVTIGTGKTLTLNLTSYSTQSFGGIITGGGSLQVDGDGTGDQQLSGQNTYTGGTIVGNAELDLETGSIDHPTGSLVVGNNSGDNGSLVLDNGSSVTNLDATIGNLSGSTGSVALNDNTDTWTNNGTLIVGNAGSGSVDITAGLVTDANAVVGNTAGSEGLVQVLGGTWTTTGSSVIIGNGGDGIVDLAAGGKINIGSGSGTLTLGNANTGAALIIGADEIHYVEENAGGILNAAIVNGTAPSFTIDDLIFSTDGSPELPYYFTKTGTSGGTPVEIDGSIHVAINGPVVLANANSTYGGGTSVTDYNELFIGASSSGGAPDNPTKGPIGIGPLTLGYDSNVDMTQSNLTLDNTIYLSTDSDSVDTLGNSSNPDNLTLTGTISGKAQILWAGTGTLTLSSAVSSFGGGVYVSQGTLNVAAPTTGGDAVTAPTYGPAGTGIIYLDDGSTLTRPTGASIVLSNSIQLANEGSQATIAGDPTGLLTLGGTITGIDSSQRLNITGPVDLTGVDDVARTLVSGTTLTVESDNGVADDDLGATGSATIVFHSDNPTVSSLSLQYSTANFTGGGGGGPVLEGVGMTNSSINFADDSHPTIEGLEDSFPSSNFINMPGSDTELILDDGVSGSPINFYGTITGAGSIDIGGGTDTGTVAQLNGNNTYTGATTIEAGNFAVAGSTNAFGPSGTIYVVGGAGLIVNSGVTISNPIHVLGDGIFMGGSGTLAPASTINLTFQNGSTLAGGTGTLGYDFPGITGNSIGTLTIASTTNVTLAQGGSLQFSLMNDTGTPGTDYSAINVNGTLTIDSSTSITPFKIYVVGIDGAGPYDGSATPASFDFNSPHSWTLLTAGSIVNPGGGFDPSDFQVNTSSFGGGFGLWSVSEPGNNTLELDFTPVPEPSVWAMLLGGSGSLVFFTWRRRKVRTA